MIINKEIFTNLIKKAYLNELNDELIIQFTKDEIKIPFFLGMVGGIISMPNKLNEEPFDMVVVNITNFLKSIKILKESFEMDFQSKQKSRFISMRDGKYENDYRLSDISLLQHDHLKIYTFQEPKFDVKININQDFIKDMLEIKSTIKVEDTSTIHIKSMGDKKLEFILGDYNKVKYKLPFEKLNPSTLEINSNFNFQKFISIIEQNKDVISGTILFKKPFIKLETNCLNNLNTIYYLVENQT